MKGRSGIDPGPLRKSALLINPWIHDFAAYDYWLQPLGLLYLASFLRSNGLEVNLINCLDPFHPAMKMVSKPPQRYAAGHGKFFQQEIEKPGPLKGIRRKYKRYGISPELFRQELETLPSPSVILVTSMMTYWYTGVAETIRIAREVHPGAPVILGGNYATICNGHASNNSGADFVIAGEAENSLQDVLEIAGAAPRYLPDGDVLDSLPYPAFDLLGSPAQVPIQSSRGCPFRCVYCASPILNRKFRRRDPVKVADEIQFWSSRGVRNFSIYDDAFLVKPEEMAIPLMKEVIAREIACRFHCPNGLHLRGISGETALLMKRSGFETLRFGFETSEPQRQAATGGKVRGEDLLAAVGYLKGAGYTGRDIGVYLLCGLPGQPASEIRASIDFVKSCGARAILAEFSPIPGTLLWDECRKNSKFDLDEPLFHNNTLLPCAGEDISIEFYRDLKRLSRI